MDDNQQVIIQQQPASPSVPPSQPVIEPSAGKSRRMLMIAIAIFVFFIIIGISIALVISKNNVSVIAPSPTPIPTLAVSPTPTIAPVSSNPIIELTLMKEKSISVPNSDITLIYKGQSAPNPKCVDCSTTTDVIIAKQANEQKLSYVCGGIAGTCTEKQASYGYEITLVKVSEDSATVKIQKQ